MRNASAIREAFMNRSRSILSRVGGGVGVGVGFGNLAESSTHLRSCSSALCGGCKAATGRDWPSEINGYTTRPEHGPCPECEAVEAHWCREFCTRLDPMDYR